MACVDHPLPIVQLAERAGIIDLGWGHPHPDALPVAGWLAATETALSTFGWQALAYGAAAGPGPLLDWLAEHLSHTDHGASPAAETFVTAGASHALELVSTVLTSPGDIVVVDSPTYHLAIRTIADRGVEIVGAPADEDGIDPAATGDLIAAAHRAGRRVSMLYIVPTFGNPTGRSLPADRRAALVALAARGGVPIVEDDTYRELVYQGSAPPSLWSLADRGSVIRIGSFAKTVAPGLRLGWINAAPKMIRTLVDRGYVDSGGGVNHITALTMATFGASGAYQEHLRAIRARYAPQRDALVGALRAELPELSVPSPLGGWFVWLPLPAGVQASTLLPAAERLGVSYMEGRRFYAQAAGDDRLRLSFSLATSPDLIEAAHRLGAAIRAQPV